MLVRFPAGISPAQTTYDALAKVNRKFADNVIFDKYENVTTQKDGRLVIKVTLKVKDSKGPGSRCAPSGRRLVAACWHVWGEFMDALGELCPTCEVKIKGAITHDYQGSKQWVLAQDHGWQDSRVSRWEYLSDLCEC